MQKWENLIKNYQNYKLSDEVDEPFKNLLKKWPDVRIDIDRLDFPDFIKKFPLTTITDVKAGQGEPHPLLSFCNFPHLLFLWKKQSSRVFNLDSELVETLSLSSADKYRLKDVRFPFKSFTLDLGDTYFSWEEVKCKFILFNSFVGYNENGESFIILIHLFGAKPPDNYKDLKQSQLIRACFPMNCDHEEFASITVEQFLDRSGNKGYKSDFMLEKLVVQLIINFCLYLQSLPNPSYLKKVENCNSGNKPIGFGGKNKTSTILPEVYEVQKTFSLSTNEKEVFKEAFEQQTLGKVSTHFRRGHFRRPPGKGDDPDAPRVIWVRPCLVKGIDKAKITQCNI